MTEDTEIELGDDSDGVLKAVANGTRSVMLTAEDPDHPEFPAMVLLTRESVERLHAFLEGWLGLKQNPDNATTDTEGF